MRVDFVIAGKFRVKRWQSMAAVYRRCRQRGLELLFDADTWPWADRPLVDGHPALFGFWRKRGSYLQMVTALRRFGGRNRRPRFAWPEYQHRTPRLAAPCYNMQCVQHLFPGIRWEFAVRPYDGQIVDWHYFRGPACPASRVVLAAVSVEIRRQLVPGAWISQPL